MSINPENILVLNEQVWHLACYGLTKYDF